MGFPLAVTETQWPATALTQGRKMKTFLTTLAVSLLAAQATHAATAPTSPVQVNALFRVLKADGTTLLGQVLVTPGGGVPMASLTVNQSDALVAANGRCAFNVKYDEVASASVKGTVNRLYSNDTLIAQNSAIDLQAQVLRTIWTQPYLYAGQNNVRIVVNADAASPAVPGVGWVRINVVGDCKVAPVTPPKAATAPPAPPAPKAPPTPPPVTPGSAAWNALYTAWGYSNYGTTQLKNKGYAGYAALVQVNADLTAVVNAKTVSQAGYTQVMARWQAIANDLVFRAKMAAVVPPAGRI
jgi:hypothetical protein